MRELKFRAWDKYKKQMSPVCDISFGDDGRALTIVFQTSPKGKYYHGLVDGENGVLMQFTGLRDKTDKEIYEGDILELRATYYDTRRDVVVYDLDMHGFMVDGRYLHDFGKYWSIEVIGNIYENPDLIVQ